MKIVHLFYLLSASCSSSPSYEHTTSFSPALHQIILSLRWRYGVNCQGIEAYWSTSLPEGTIVEAMAGPKTNNPHFDDDALQRQSISIDANGVAYLPLSTVSYIQEQNFLNIRVWGTDPAILHMLKKSEQNGGFSIAESPNGPYGWAETTLPKCTPKQTQN